MKKKRTPWPRWAKILRNILLTLLLGLLMWDAWGCPTFSFRADLRRKERQMLLPEPEAVADLELFYGNPFRIEQSGNKVIMSMATRGRFFTVARPSVYTLEEGPELLCIPYTICLRDEADQRQAWAAYAAFHPPAGTARAVLTLHNADGVFTADSVPAEQMLLFYARPEQDTIRHDIWLDPDSYTYELAFYDANDAPLDMVTGGGEGAAS